ncbi:MAG: GFA family protein [Gammaproteobacteria bacterium]|nr:GFA family protein [Gammaproteobacteria bacterium]
MYHGSCLCGQIRFEISGEIKNIIYCHCSQCRKAQGSAFAANGYLKREQFCISQGREKLTAYESTPGQIKYFCSICGSPIMSESNMKPDRVRVRLGTIESDIEEKPMAHIFVSSKANWESIQGDLPQYEGYEPNRDKM